MTPETMNVSGGSDGGWWRIVEGEKEVRLISFV